MPLVTHREGAGDGQKVEDRLKDYGCELDAVAFRALLTDTLSGMHPTWNDVDLMHRPSEALRYCQGIRQASGCFDLPDEFILRALSGIRKHG
jgi:hypothetical protein